MHMEIQDLRKELGREASANLWCIRCRVSRHMKDLCPLPKDYLQTGGPSLMHPGSRGGPSLVQLGLGIPTLWWEDCRVAGLHDTNH